jgi:DNA-binding SARP family transcriptional activator
MDTQILLLGGIRLVHAGSPLTQFPTDKSRALLACLALEAGKPQRRESLAALLWPDWPEDLARRHLRQAFYLLRQAIEDHSPNLADRLLLADRKTIELRAENLEVDALTLQRAFKGSHADRVRAARLYRGELLAGFSLPDAPTFDEWLAVERESLHIAALALLETLADETYQRGEFDHSRQHAARQIALDPLRETAHAQLMRALAASGNRPAALSQYETLRETLAAELGVLPAETTRQLYEAIKAGSLAAPAPAPPPPAARLTNFPAQLTPFLGRAAELETLHARLADPAVRLITITGPGGQGKTRLSLEAARRAAGLPNFPDGIYFIPLAAADRLELVIPIIAAQMDMTALHGAGLTEQFRHFIASKRALLVLDNLEHLTGQADILSMILQAAPGIKLLTTTREPLNLHGETRLSLGGLSYPGDDLPPGANLDPGFAAAALFAASARRVAPGFSPGEGETRAIARICALVDGSPLALEIAASWVRVYDCETIAAEIVRSLDFLTSPFRNAPDRQRSMRAIFEHSWQLLTDSERRTLAQLSVFSGDFSAQAATAVAEASPLELAALLDKSLLQRKEGGRFILHDLLRQFLAGQAAAISPDGLRARHAAYYLNEAAARTAGLQGGAQRQALDEMERELGNLRAAWAHALTQGETGLVDRALTALFHFFDTRSRFVEGELVFVEAVAAAEKWRATAGNTRLAARLAARLGWFAFHLGQAARARELLAGSLETLEGADRIFSLNYLGAVLRHGGAYEAARAHLSEGLALARAAGDRLGESIALNILGQIDSLEGNLEQARALCRESLAIKREIGDEWGMTFSLTYLGRVAQQLDEHSEARALFEESMSLSREFGDRRGAAFALQNLGDTAQAGGDARAAQACYAESARIYEEIGAKGDAERVRGMI